MSDFDQKPKQLPVSVVTSDDKTLSQRIGERLRVYWKGGEVEDFEVDQLFVDRDGSRVCVEDWSKSNRRTLNQICFPRAQFDIDKIRQALLEGRTPNTELPVPGSDGLDRYGLNTDQHRDTVRVISDKVTRYFSPGGDANTERDIAEVQLILDKGVRKR